MGPILIAINILAGLFLVGVVLLQSGKGADMGAAFGGAGSTVFGPSGAGSVLTKATGAIAALFMGTSLALAVLSADQGSVIDGMEEPTAAAAPEAPVAIPTPPTANVAVETGEEAPGDSPAIGDDADEAAAGDAAQDENVDVIGEAIDEAQKEPETATEGTPGQAEGQAAADSLAIDSGAETETAEKAEQAREAVNEAVKEGEISPEEAEKALEPEKAE
jgi:preprotein translocase subunit SecG